MIKYMKARPRLALATTLGCVLWFLLPTSLREATRLLIAWDVTTGLYLALVTFMISQSDTSKIRARAAAQDEGRCAILILTIVTAVASLAAIVAELSNAKELQGVLRDEHITLAAITVFLSWTFMQTMFALHYAHEFYMEEDGKAVEGLEFPGKLHTPDYWDFIYYSFVIGTACATADINITSSAMRKTTTLHCVIAFFFNTTILALTINIGASLFG